MKDLFSRCVMGLTVISAVSFTTLRAEARDVVAVGKSITVPAGKTEHDVVVISGSATIDGTVEGDLVVVLGDLRLNGRVGGQVVVVGGRADLGPEAQVEREAVFVGSEVSRDPQAKVEGDFRDIFPNLHLPRLSGMWDWIDQGLLLGRILPPAVPWVWTATGILLVIYLLIALIFKRPLLAGVEAIETRPIASLVAGFLVFLLIGPLLLLLVVSVAGIVLVPFLLSALVFAFLLGKVVMYQCVGFRFSSKLRTPGWPSLVALLIGTGVFVLLYMVPILGILVWKLVTILGLGAVTLATFRIFRREKPVKTTTISLPMPAIGTSAVGGTAASVAPAVPGMASGFAANAPASASLASAQMEAPTPAAPSDPPHLSPSGAVAASATLSFVPAGFWIRLCSMVLDFVLVGGCLAILHVWPLFPLFWIAYHIGFWIWKGTTVGDIIVGIKCIRTDGRSLGAAVAVVRAFSSFFSAAAFGLGFFWAGWDQHKQAWHDKIAGTFMVKMPRGIPLV